ncbi:MAG: ABC transporter ATP-binding protein [Varibaculum sp.]|nr:ABC transporter ATP-binding protein [Varibaculum sp.]
MPPSGGMRGAHGNSGDLTVRDARGTLRRLAKLYAPQRWRILVIAIAELVGVLASVAAPALIGVATNVIFTGVLGKMLGQGTTRAQAVAQLRAEGNDDLAAMVQTAAVTPGDGINFNLLLQVVAGIAGAYLLQALAHWASALLARRAVQDSAYRLRGMVYDHVDRLPVAYIDEQPRGDLISRMTNDIDNTMQSIQHSATQMIRSLLQLLGVIVMMMLLSVKLAFIALVLIPVGALVAGVIAKKAAPAFKAQWRATGDISSLVDDSFSGHEVIEAYGLARQQKDIFNKKNYELFTVSYRSQFLSGAIRPVMSVFSNMSFVVLAVVGGLEILAGAMTLGMVQAFITYSRQLSQPVESLAGQVNMVQSALASAERVYALLDAEPMPAQKQTRPYRGGDVEFNEVEFGYHPDQVVLDHLTFTVRSGETVAIVGKTGVGKTTLINLFMRFYDLRGGEIRIGGVNIADMSADDLRSRVAMVLQDTWLFEGTIRDNIRFGNPEASDDEVYGAARAVGVHRMIRSLPEGYDTIVGNASGAVSAGEKQLITIARAFLSHPEVLILDEATSSVDTRTEMQVQRAMQRLRVGRTSFVIAHRLSTIQDADRILVLAEGQLVESGTFTELLARGGVFADLYQAQFQ